VAIVAGSFPGVLQEGLAAIGQGGADSFLQLERVALTASI
jgi:hypothetical protein